MAARRKLQEQPLPIFVLGHSVGGLVTATSALRDQGGVRGMILIAPTLDWDIGGAMRFVARTAAILLPTFAVPVPTGDPADQSRDEQFTARLAVDPLYNHGRITWVTAAGGAATSYANWRKYPDLALPLLVVNGTADKVTAASGSQRFVEAVTAGDKTLVLVEDGRHSLLDDPPSSARALQVVLDWLELRLPANRAPSRVLPTRGEPGQLTGAALRNGRRRRADEVPRRSMAPAAPFRRFIG